MISLSSPRNTCFWGLAHHDMFRRTSKKLFARKGNHARGITSFEGYGCLLPSSEVYTKHGWKRLDEISEQEEIFQYNINDKTITWCLANKHVIDFDDIMIECSSTLHKHCYTQDHRIPLLSPFNNKISVITANELIKRKETIIPISGEYNSTEDLDEDLNVLRLAVAIQADGSFDNDNYVRLGFGFVHKIDRFKNITKSFHGYDVYSIHGDRRTARFVVTGDTLSRVKKYLSSDTKTFNTNALLQLSQQCLLCFVNEFKYWDGLARNNSFLYFTTNKTNADLLCLLSHLTQHSANMWINADNNNGYGSGNNKVLYTVNVKPRNYLCFNKIYTKEINYIGKVYCVTTSTGFFLTRHNGLIVVTGNSNMQNPDEHTCRMYLADEGKRLLQIDQAGAEALVVAYLTRHGNFRDLFLNGIKSHVYVGMHLFAHVWQAEVAEADVSWLCKLPIKELKTARGFKEVEKRIKLSDSWIPSKRYYFMAKQVCHCVDSDTKVLTPRGWTSVNNKPLVIAVFQSADWTKKFEAVSWNEYSYTGNMYDFEGYNVSQVVTPEHKVPFYFGNLMTYQPACYIAERTNKVNLVSMFKYREKLKAHIDLFKVTNLPVYCPTTSTGFFLIKRDGKISVTGNSSNYGIHAPALRLNILQKSDGKVALTSKQAEDFLTVYHTLFPELREWHRQVEQMIRMTRTLRNLFGHPREFLGVFNEELLKSAYSFVPQSTVGTISANAVVKLQTYIEEERLPWDILNEKHDSVLMQVPDNSENIEHASAKMREAINVELVAPSGQHFNMKSGLQIGYNWGHYDEVENPLGMKEV